MLLKRKNSVLVCKWHSHSGVKKRGKAVSSEYQSSDLLWKTWLVELPARPKNSGQDPLGTSRVKLSYLTCSMASAVWSNSPDSSYTTHSSCSRIWCSFSSRSSCMHSRVKLPSWDSHRNGSLSCTTAFRAEKFTPTTCGNKQLCRFPQNCRSSWGRGTWCASVRAILGPNWPKQTNTNGTVQPRPSHQLNDYPE